VASGIVVSDEGRARIRVKQRVEGIIARIIFKEAAAYIEVVIDRRRIDCGRPDDRQQWRNTYAFPTLQEQAGLAGYGQASR
jgi:hypothetical protein